MRANMLLSAACRASRGLALIMIKPRMVLHLLPRQGLHQTPSSLAEAILLALLAGLPCAREVREPGGRLWPQLLCRALLLRGGDEERLPSPVQAVGRSSQGGCPLLELVAACQRSGDGRGHRGWQGRRSVLIAIAGSKQVPLQTPAARGTYVSGVFYHQQSYLYMAGSLEIDFRFISLRMECDLNLMLGTKFALRVESNPKPCDSRNVAQDELARAWLGCH